MQEKTEEIKTIQMALWDMYKEFLSHKDKELYQKQAFNLEYACEDGLKWFCRDLNRAWAPVIDSAEECLRNGNGIEDMHKCIMDIQNSAWAIYREFLKGHQVPEYTQKAAGLVEKYKNDEDMKLFAQILIMAWVPVINSLAEDFRKGKEQCRC